MIYQNLLEKAAVRLTCRFYILEEVKEVEETFLQLRMKMNKELKITDFRYLLTPFS
jgi:hypothetical protein